MKLPKQNWRQSNISEKLGDIVESFNLDLNTNIGSVRTTRAKLIKSGDNANPNFGAVSAIVYFIATIRVFASFISKNQWDGGNSPFDTLTLDSGGTGASFTDGDAKVFNNLLYTTSGANMNRYDDSTETSVSTGLTANTFHLLETFSPDGSGERLYVTQGDDKVWSVNQSNVLATSGQYTLDLALEPDYQITGLSAGTDRLWIAVSSAGNNSGGGDSYVFTWDGTTANAPSSKYKINSSRIMAMIVKDDTPYIVTIDGRFMAWNGGVFQEIDRFPIKDNKIFTFSISNLSQNAIHPRGMAIDKDDILICVSNLAEGSGGTTAIYHDFPAGVWRYNSIQGLHHYLSPSYQAVSDTGTTNMTDHGQFRAGFAYPVEVFDVSNLTASDGGRIMFGMSYFTSASVNLTNGLTFGIWTDDTEDDTQKAGWLVTSRIHSLKFKDMWDKAYLAMSDLTTTGDRAVLKYRVDEKTIYTNITWNGTGAFTAATDLSDFEEGDEVCIVQGTGGGACSHIKMLESSVGSSNVTLDTEITGVTGTSVARLQKWKKILTLEQDPSTEGKSIGENPHWIQFKVFGRWTGARELYEIFAERKKSI